MYDTGYYATGYYATGYYLRGALVEPDQPLPGGGPGKRPSSQKYVPGISGNRHLAMCEDEEIVTILQALLSRRIH